MLRLQGLAFHCLLKMCSFFRSRQLNLSGPLTVHNGPMLASTPAVKHSSLQQELQAQEVMSTDMNCKKTATISFIWKARGAVFGWFQAPEFSQPWRKKRQVSCWENLYITKMCGVEATSQTFQHVIPWQNLTFFLFLNFIPPIVRTLPTYPLPIYPLPLQP